MDDQTDSVLDRTPRFDEPSAAAVEYASQNMVHVSHGGLPNEHDIERFQTNQQYFALHLDIFAAARVAAAKAEERARMIARAERERLHWLERAELCRKKGYSTKEETTRAEVLYLIKDWLERYGQRQNNPPVEEGGEP